MSIVERRKIWFSISLIIIVVGLICIPLRGGLNYDIDFSGGTMLHINIGEDFNARTDIEPIVKDFIGGTGFHVQRVAGKNEVVIKTRELSTQEREDLFYKISEKYNLIPGNEGDLLNHANISPVVSNEMKQAAVLAVTVAAIAMLIYISFRFSDFRFGISAVIALIHDILVLLAVYAIFYIPVNTSFIAAMLTIVGYSINDTIVIFDRIRENQKIIKRGRYEELVNTSIGQTISRSINTSITTFVMISILAIVGVLSIKWFAIPLMVGILSGTYSSIFIASPIWYVFKKKAKHA